MAIEQPKIDKYSPTWVNLKKYLQDRLQKLRVKNDATQNHEQTERLRGQITEIKMLLDLEKECGE